MPAKELNQSFVPAAHGKGLSPHVMAVIIPQMESFIPSGTSQKQLDAILKAAATEAPQTPQQG